MSNPEQEELAKKLLLSLRGSYIIGKALAIAYRELEKVPESRRQISDMSDMKTLGEAVFKIGWEVEMQFPTHNDKPTDGMFKIIRDEKGESK